MQQKRIVLTIGVVLSLVSPAAAAIQLQSVASGFLRPLFVTGANDGTNRLFIVEQDGYIRVLQPGSSSPTLFLDVHTLVRIDGNEQGPLGLAFHPHYSINGRFFIFYTRTDRSLRISEYLVSADPNVADTTEIPLLTIPHPGQDNHNGYPGARHHSGPRSPVSLTPARQHGTNSGWRVLVWCSCGAGVPPAGTAGTAAPHACLGFPNESPDPGRRGPSQT